MVATIKTITNRSETHTMLNREQNVQVSDTTDDDSSNTPGSIIITSIKGFFKIFTCLCFLIKLF